MSTRVFIKSLVKNCLPKPKNVSKLKPNFTEESVYRCHDDIHIALPNHYIDMVLVKVGD